MNGSSIKEARQMRFMWLAHAVPYPPKAGFLLRSYNLLRELARYHTVDLVAFIQEHWISTHFLTLTEGLRESQRALQEFCRRVTFLPIDRINRPWGKQLTALQSLVTASSYTATWLRSSSARAALARELAAEDYDLVHFDTIGLAAYRDLVGSLPATLTHHNVESHLLLRRAESAGNVLARSYFRHEGRMLRDVERRTAAQFAAHITCSELDTERLREIVPEANIVVIPNGVDCDYFASAQTTVRPDSLIFVGTMNWYPNVDAMLFLLQEVWPQLKRRTRTVTLDIVGSNPPDSLVRLAQSLPGVTVHGYVPDVRPLLDSAALFVCPIRDGGGTKLKLLDAFAMGKCVVAHPIACEGIDAVADREVVVASTPAEFVTTISALLADPHRRRAVGQAARALVERSYSYRSIGAQFSSLLEQTAQRATPVPST
jgi:sugar transferase (PEP-CTERM/EpsH1 system associated)